MGHSLRVRFLADAFHVVKKIMAEVPRLKDHFSVPFIHRLAVSDCLRSVPQVVNLDLADVLDVTVSSAFGSDNLVVSHFSCSV
jgi:hypothetical protein